MVLQEAGCEINIIKKKKKKKIEDWVDMWLRFATGSFF